MNPHELATTGMHQIGGVWRLSLHLVINLNWTSLDLRIPTGKGADSSVGIPNGRV